MGSQTIKVTMGMGKKENGGKKKVEEKALPG